MGASNFIFSNICVSKGPRQIKNALSSYFGGNKQFFFFTRLHEPKSNRYFSSIQSKSSQDIEANTTSSSSISSQCPVLKLKKVAVVRKMTRYEFEKRRYEGFTEEQFKHALAVRGSNYSILLEKHKKHNVALTRILNVLKKRGMEYRICTRGHTNYSKDVVEWADAVITAGGDGTFLSAASKVTDKRKPLIGINTDPERSEGHLCLPPKYSTNLEEALSKFEEGRFRWLYRQRIRIIMTGTDVNFQPIENGDILHARMKGRSGVYADQYDAVENSKSSRIPHCYSKQLPVLALNEVFIGESLASIPSYYELQIDDGPLEKQKSSGLCIATGTGSTAWSYNICRLYPGATRSLLKIAFQCQKKEEGSLPSDDLVDRVTEIYSNSFMFDANERKMLYSIRDPMHNKVYHCDNPHGFAQEITIRSRCWDASLCIDGDTSFVFNDGALATLQLLPEDALRTVVLDEP